jgi:hypothetical protein
MRDQEMARPKTTAAQYATMILRLPPALAQMIKRQADFLDRSHNTHVIRLLTPIVETVEGQLRDGILPSDYLKVKR